MSTRNDKKKDPIETKIMKIRLTLVKARRQKPSPMYDDILEVLDDHDIWKRRAQTLEWMLHAEGKSVNAADIDAYAAAVKKREC